MRLRNIKCEPVIVDVSRPSGLDVEEFGLRGKFLSHMLLEISDPTLPRLLYSDPSFGLCETPEAFSRLIEARDYRFINPIKYGLRGVWR